MIPLSFARLGLAIGAAASTAGAALACTTMLLGAPGSTLLAYSYDFFTGAGAMVVNARSAERRSVLDHAPDVWRVRYGSVTFNQFGLGMPMTGMNEAGLVVTLMWNDGVEFAAPDQNPSVNELELIQRLLDTAATVPEAIAEARAVAVPGIVPIHYFVTDPTGVRAILAHQDGVLTVLTGDEVPVPALTNSDYAVLQAELPMLVGFGGSRAIAESDDVSDALANSVGRFARAASSILASGAEPSETTAFAALEGVENQGTQWNVVYDPQATSIAFRLGTAGPLHRIALGDLDFACRDQPAGLRLDTAPVGDVGAALIPFGMAETLALITEVYPEFPPTAGMPEEALPGIAAATLAATHCLP
jgi:choloylglycine hydrolase